MQMEDSRVFEMAELVVALINFQINYRKQGLTMSKGIGADLGFSGGQIVIDPFMPVPDILRDGDANDVQEIIKMLKAGVKDFETLFNIEEREAGWVHIQAKPDAVLARHLHLE